MLILTYNADNKAFEGSLENTNTTIAPQVRAEVHVYDTSGKNTEYGPATPAEIAPEETSDVFEIKYSWTD